MADELIVVDAGNGTGPPKNLDRYNSNFVSILFPGGIPYISDGSQRKIVIIPFISRYISDEKDIKVTKR